MFEYILYLHNQNFIIRNTYNFFNKIESIVKNSLLYNVLKSYIDDMDVRDLLKYSLSGEPKSKEINNLIYKRMVKIYSNERYSNNNGKYSIGFGHCSCKEDIIDKRIKIGKK